MTGPHKSELTWPAPSSWQRHGVSCWFYARALPRRDVGLASFFQHIGQRLGSPNWQLLGEPDGVDVELSRLSVETALLKLPSEPDVRLTDELLGAQDWRLMVLGYRLLAGQHQVGSQPTA